MKKCFYRSVFLFAFTAALCGSSPAAEDVNRIVDELQRKYGSISTIEAGFTQEVAARGLAKPQASEGRVYFKKPGKMRWAYSRPERDELVSNGKTVWVYQPDINQVMERPARGVQSTIATDFLSGVGNLNKDFNITLAEERKDAYVLSLAPKEPLQNVQRIFVELDRKTFLISKTVVQDLFGNETRVLFKDIKVNAPQKDGLFEFRAPEGATVIRP